MARYGQLIALLCLLALSGVASAVDKGAAMSQVGAQAQSAYSAMSADFQAQRKVCVWTTTATDTGIAYGAVVVKTRTCLSVGNASVNGTTYTLAQVSYSGSCATRGDYNGVFPGNYGAPRSGSVQCASGCMQVWTPNADGTWNGTYRLNATCDVLDNSDQQCAKMGLTTGYHYSNYTKTCEPDVKECPQGQAHNAKGECVVKDCPAGMTLSQFGTCDNEKNECPAGQIKAPSGQCLPGDGQCAQGEVKGKDGTCKRDADGDGEPDEGEEDGTSDPTFGGGDNCDSPPSCSGDVIMCGQARIQWRIDCNTRKNRNISGGTCDSPPICTGEKCDALEYSSLLFQWRTACAAEKTAGKSGNGDSGQPDWTKVGGMSQDPGAGASADDTKVLTTKTVSTNDLDQSGFGGGSCIGFAGGASGAGVVAQAYIEELGNPSPSWCNFISMLRASLILCAAVASVFILAKGGAG